METRYTMSKVIGKAVKRALSYRPWWRWLVYNPKPCYWPLTDEEKKIPSSERYKLCGPHCNREGGTYTEVPADGLSDEGTVIEVWYGMCCPKGYDIAAGEPVDGKNILEHYTCVKKPG